MTKPFLCLKLSHFNLLVLDTDSLKNLKIINQYPRSESLSAFNLRKIRSGTSMSYSVVVANGQDEWQKGASYERTQLNIRQSASRFHAARALL